MDSIENSPEKGTENTEDTTNTNEDPFKPSKKGLLITKGYVAGIPALILIDNGAEINHISNKFCLAAGIKLQKADFEAQMANSSKERMESTTDKVRISIGPYTESMRLAANTLNYDVILGKKWTSEHNAKIDCLNNVIEFQHRNRTHKITASEGPPTDTLSVNSIEKHSKREYHVYAIVLRNTEAPENQSMPHGLTKLLTRYKDVFPEKLPPGLPPRRSKDYEIDLVHGAVPQRKGLYRMSDTELKEVQNKLTELIDLEFIRPSSSPWGAPVLFASKKDGGLRFCIDYRALNRLTVKNSYPLPRVDDLLDQLNSAKYYSKIDLLMGYHQIRLSPDSIPKTAFRTKYGSFEFLVLPFGLTNAPGFFMTLMNEVFSDYIDKFMIVYLDDILIYSRNWEEHLRHIKLVLQRLRKHKLYGKLTKCIFGVQEVEYLGFILKTDRITVDPNKVQAIQAWKVPSCKKDIQSFLGMVNFYRRFIKNCASIAKPLTQLTKNVPFDWNAEAQKSFDALKEVLVTAPVLKAFNPNCPIIVTTDASRLAIGAVLEQEFPDGCHPVAFISKTLNSAEQNYAPHNSEMLAIVYAVTSWRCYLHGRKFVVQTDHAPLRHFFTQNKLSPLQVRWLEKLLPYDFSIQPIKGKANRVADALSRRNVHTKIDDGYPKRVLQDFYKSKFHVHSISTLEPSSSIAKQIVHGYANDPEFRTIYDSPRDPFRIQNRMLYNKDRLCVPNIPLRQELMHDFHATACAGHLGETKTRHRLSKEYFWKTLRNDVKDYVAGCKICQQTKAKNQKPYGLIQPIDPPKDKWSVLTMDFIEPLPKTRNGHTSILNICDKLTKTLHTIPLPEHYNAVYVAEQFMKTIYRHYGLPTKIISDRDKVFMSRFWKTLFDTLGVKIAPSTAYHPQTDGQTEIANRKLEEMIRAFTSFRKDDWDKHLIEFEVAYNSAIHSTTLCTPFYLNYGIHPRTIPAQALSETHSPSVNEFLENIQNATKKAIKNIEKKNETMAKYANRKRIPHNFKIGDQVWLSTKNLKLEAGSTTRKLHPKYCGPFRILKQITPVSYKLDTSEPMRAKRIHDTFHVSLLRPFTEDRFKRTEEPGPSILFEDGHKEWEVEAILSEKVIRNKKHYLVKWKNYPNHENTWEPEENLENAQASLQDYIASRRCSP